MVPHPIRILGIDPGLRRTGWGLIESDGNRLIHVACGSVETSDRASLGERLVVIHDGLIRIIEMYAPHEAAVEQTFVNTNAQATDAMICTFECTFCRDCAETRLHGRCPNCGGNLVARPIRPADKLAKYPASTQRVFKPQGCGRAA